MTLMFRRAVVATLLLTGVGLPSAVRAQGSPQASGAVTLFENVRIFDGKSATLSAPSNVLVRGNKIETISTQPIAVDRRADTHIIDGGGRTLMPGLIDAHWHAMMVRVTPVQAFGDVGYNNLVAGAEATDTLMRGFTTVRDVGGPVFGLKSAIDEGIVKGPRIYPSGAVITVTSGHGDFRQLTDLPRTIGGMLARMEQLEVWPGIAKSYELAKEYKLKTAWGTDVLFSAALAKQQGAILASLTRWYTPAEALIMATSANAELLALSGKRNPYPGKLGVVEQGALADLLLVDGNPLENINLIADPDKNFLVIMKDGVIYKNAMNR